MKRFRLSMAIVAMGVAAFAAFVAGCTPQAEEIKNTVWRIEKLENQGSAQLTGDVPVWITIDSEGNVSGTGGVNRVSGRVVTASNGKLEFGPLVSTRMAGPNMEYEDIYLRMLNEVRTYKIHGNTLKLYDASGKLLATYERAPDSLKD